MSDQGKANYEGYRAAAMGRSLATGDPLPEWDDLSYQIRLAWDAGACSVELWLAEAPVDEDMPGGASELEADIASLTDQRNRVSAKADHLRALLDHETRLTLQAGLPAEVARVREVRAQAGLEAL